MQIKTFAEIRDALITRVGALTPISNFNVGGVARTIIEAVSEAASELYMFAAEELANASVATATGVWLERKAAEYGVERHSAVKTKGVVTFSRALARNTNVTIPAGTVVATLKDANGNEYRYATDAQVVLASGTTSVEAAVTASWPSESETNGSAWNVAPGAIKAMKTYITGVDAVTNAADWITTAGSDEESDAALRRRVVAKWAELARGGTAAAYISWALSVEGVASAWVNDSMPRGEGTVDIYILDADGSPSPALVSAVQAVIDANRPITVDALVRAPGTVTVAVSMRVIPRIGFDAAAIEAEISRRLSVYFGDVADATLNITPLGVGRDVVSSRIAAIAMDVPGVYKVTMLAPSSDVTVDPYEFAELGTVTIIFGTATNE